MLVITKIYRMNYGARVRELRTAASMTQKLLAERMGILNPNFISQIETGKTPFGLSVIEKVCGALSITLLTFFDVGERPPVKKESKIVRQFEALIPKDQHYIERTLQIMASQKDMRGKKRPDLPTFGQRLKYIREEILDETNKEFTGGTPVTVEDIARYELDEDAPSGTFLTMLHGKVGAGWFNWLIKGKVKGKNKKPRPRGKT